MKTLNRMKLLSELGKNSQSYKGKEISTVQKRKRTVNLRKSILIVDNQPEILESLSDFLTYGGYLPITALSVKEGIAKLHRYTDISLIVCDIMMPEDDGYSMLQYLKGNLRFHSIPIIVSSSLNSSDAIRRAFELGVRHYIVKPYTSAQFLARIQETIDSGLGTILVVTEDFVSAKFLTSAITRIGYRVLLAEDGKRALDVLSQETIDGILSELALLDMTGLNLLLQAQEIKGGIPFIYIDDRLLDVTENDIISVGGYGILRKPFNNDDVARKVARLIFNR